MTPVQQHGRIEKKLEAQELVLTYTVPVPHRHTHTYRHTLTLTGPCLLLQHQVLFGKFQFLLQTLVLGPQVTDSLLAMLQQTQPGTGLVHHLLFRWTGVSERELESG